MELGVPPGRGDDLIETVDGAGQGPVDERHRIPVPGHDVPGPGVAVPDHRVRAGVVHPPRLPYGIGRWPEARGGGVHPAQEPADLPDAPVRPSVRVDESALDVGQHLVAVGVQAVADHSGEPVNPYSSKWRSRAWTVPDQGRAGRLTVWSRRLT